MFINVIYHIYKHYTTAKRHVKKKGTRMVKRFGNKRLVAFTLAEVLITLAIIGVVATMTIPTLIANYQERSWNTSATVFDRKLTEALKIMNSQSSLAGHKTTENFVKELSKHLKIVRTCDNSNLTDCFVDSMTMRENTITVDLNNISTSADLGQSEWDTNIVGIQLANGTNALVAYNPDCKQDPYSNQITGSDCLAIMYDTTGFKSPNHLSKDLRANANVKKVGAKSVCAFEVNGKCFTAPYPDPHKWNACTTSGTSEDAEDKAFMAKYDLDYCMNSSYGTDDYWAGAVDACGGTDKMPNQKQLQELAAYLYPDISSINASGYTYCPKDDSGYYTKCRQDSSLGFANSTGTSEFYVWSGTEFSSDDACNSYFSPMFTYYLVDARYGSYLQAVCLGD